MKIAILGTRGIPNAYGGFEQFAEYLSVGLAGRGHSVTVYNTGFHEYAEDNYKGVSIRKIYSPEKYIGAAANFIYDYLCLRDALKKDFDIIYELGYHSNAPSYYMLRRQLPIVVTNMDGIEWKRSKWNTFTQKLILKLEKIAVAKSDYLVSDNPAIRDYYWSHFGKDSFYIPYGANIVSSFDEKILSGYNIQPGNFFLSIARLEPENNIEMILDGFAKCQTPCSFLVVGNKDTKYGKYLQNRYKKVNVCFLGAIYDKGTLDAFRYFSRIYFHGHSVGGTNPTLLEAMASQAYIAAHDNPFNKAVLGDDSLYFNKTGDIISIIQSCTSGSSNSAGVVIKHNLDKIRQHYSWDRIITDYENLFLRLLQAKKRLIDP